MSTITIEYCEPCGYKGPAEDVKERLETSLDENSIELEEGHGGVFKVYVNGEEVYDKADHDNQVKNDVIEKAVLDAE